jgi:hypothetical protein
VPIFAERICHGRSWLRFRQPLKLCGVDQAHSVGDLFGAANLRVLTTLDGFAKHRGLQKRVVGVGVEPREAASENFNREAGVLKICQVEVGDLELAAAQGLRRLASSMTSGS